MFKKVRKILALFMLATMITTSVSFISLIDCKAGVPFYYYKAKDNYRIKEEKYVGSDGSTIIRSYEYDEKGRLTGYTYHSSHGELWIKTFEYDKNGYKNKETVISPSESYIVTFAYDKNYNVTKETYKYSDGSSGTCIFKYDKNRNIIQKTYKNVDGYSGTYTYAYDKNGNKTKEIRERTDGYLYIYTYTYDKNNKKIEETHYDNGDSTIITYTYDKNGNIAKRLYKCSDGYLMTVTCKCDKNGNIEKEIVEDNDGASSYYTYTYDKNGNRTKETYKFDGFFATTTYEYEKFDLGEKNTDKDHLVRLSKNKYEYDGNEKTPVPIFVDEYGIRYSLIKDKDYKITYSNNKNVGTAKAKITFMGKYKNISPVTLKFKIVPSQTSISKLESTSKGFKATWKKRTTQVTGYELQYSTSSKFKSGTIKTIKITSPKTVSKTFSKLKGNTTYYVRIRTYKVVGDKNYYSSWSTAKSIKTKR